MLAQPIIVKFCKHVGWYGHVKRRPPNYVKNLALQLSISGRSSRGTPKTRSEDVVIEDINECNVCPASLPIKKITHARDT